MSHIVQRRDYIAFANMLRVPQQPARLTALLENNLHIILSALDIAAADPAPRTVRCMTPHIAEPEADSDRTVHPKMWQTLVPNEMDLLRRRLAELEKLANETAAYLVNPSGSRISVLARARDRWLKTLADAS